MKSVATAFRAMAQNYLNLPSTVHLLCFGALLNRIGSFVMLFLTIYVTEQLHASPRFATWCVSAFGFGCMISNLIGGQLADQLGRRPTLLLALFGGATSLATMSLISNPLVFMAVLFVFALVMEMYRPATAAVLGDVTNLAQRPHAYALMFMAINLGFSFAPPIGGTLAEHSFTALFLTDAATTAAYGLVVLFFLRETRPQKSETKDQIHEVGMAAAVKHIAGNTTFLIFCGCHLLSLIVFMQGFTTLPLYVRNLGFTTQQFGLMICVNGVLIVLFQMPLTHWLSRFNRAHVLIVGELFMAAGFGLTMFADSAWKLVGTIVLWTTGEILQAPYKQTIVSELAPTELRGRYMGVFSLAFASALMIAPVAGGELLTRFGAQGLWPACSLLLIVTTLLYMWLSPRLASPRAVASVDTVPAGKSATAPIAFATEFDPSGTALELSSCESPIS